ncbi:hypothetical protein [Scatolibacter rhodanostii]|uniref:hypothetical protein n=1 Tax=Scatolibacter rhodanostii TaxID=2014781 RepID=UPI000C06C897|nr:hypothetical protein [Scatolibacter rhodanostii]
MKFRVKLQNFLNFFFLALCLWVITPQSAFAITSESATEIPIVNLEEWDNGAKVTKEFNEETQSVTVTADTIGLTEDYYSVFLYDYTVRDADDYDGIRFHLKNLSQGVLAINIALKISDDTDVTMTNNSFALLESEGQENPDAVKISYGTLPIPADFDGVVYIPFAQLTTANAEEKPLIHQIQSFGITTVIDKEDQKQYAISDIAFLSGSVPAMKENYYLITLSGDDEIAQPNVGSVIQTYHAKIIDLEGNPVEAVPIFYFQEQPAGLVLTDDGQLELQSHSTASEINLYARTEHSLNSGKLAIKIKKFSLEGTKANIPNPVDVSQIVSKTDVILNQSVNKIRVFGVILLVFLFAIFYTWLHDASKHKKVIEKKLYHNYHEEDKI